MLTPVDIQQKKFNIGLGYDKKDVNTFFESVAESYEQLYRSNAELKEKVETLTDGLQHYKSKESALEKSLLKAEKDSEDTKSKATKEAKNIELEAKNKAKLIVGEAEERLEQLKADIAELETRYAAYKSNFATMLKKQAEFLDEVDFDVDAKIDERAFALIAGSMPQQAAPSDGGSFGTFSGDPQMRDSSTLGGMSGGGMMGSGGDVNSTSAVYTSMLSANENFVDPFNPNKEDNGRYNPYDGRQATKKTKSSGQKFTVNTGKKVKRTSGATSTDPDVSNNDKETKQESASTPRVDESPTPRKETVSNTVEEPVKETPTEETYTKPTDNSVSETVTSTSGDTSSHGIKMTIPEELKEKLRKRTEEAAAAKARVQEAMASEAPTTSDADTAEELDVEIEVPESSLLGNGEDSDKETDEFGFEFI